MPDEEEKAQTGAERYFSDRLEDPDYQWHYDEARERVNLPPELLQRMKKFFQDHKVAFVTPVIQRRVRTSVSSKVQESS